MKNETSVGVTVSYTGSDPEDLGLRDLAPKHDYLEVGGDPSILKQVIVRRALGDGPVAIPAQVDGTDRQVSVSYEAYGIDQYDLDIHDGTPLTNVKWLVSGASSKGLSINDTVCSP